MAGTLKLNVDGCAKGNPGKGGYGGILRDHDENWMGGFKGRLPFCSSLVAELTSLKMGASFLVSCGYKGCILETDSNNAIKLIVGNNCPNHALKGLIEDCKFLVQRCNGNLGFKNSPPRRKFLYG